MRTHANAPVCRDIPSICFGFLLDNSVAVTCSLIITRLTQILCLVIISSLFKISYCLIYTCDFIVKHAYIKRNLIIRVIWQLCK